MKRALISLAFAIMAIFSHAQTVEMTPLGLPYAAVPSTGANGTIATMQFIGQRLYVPTVGGIYSIDPNAGQPDWTLEGFEGQPILEFVKCGEEILAITRNIGHDLLLRSTDGGKTFADAFPQEFLIEANYQTVTRLVQDPAEPLRLYLCSPYVGIIRSEDFGQTWSLLTDLIFNNGSYTGFEIHPLDNRILMQHAESENLHGHIQISYDGGQTWLSSDRYLTPDITFPNEFLRMDNCIHDVAFHPTDINTWVFGGEGILCKTTDRGLTWQMKKNGWNIDLGYMYRTAYDTQNPDILYSVGVVLHLAPGTLFQILVSLDGGETWQEAYSQTHPDFYNYCDLRQDSQNIYILDHAQLYKISKQSLLQPLGGSAITPVSCSENSFGGIFNLQGQRLSSEPGGGIYIINGKKIVKK